MPLTFHLIHHTHWDREWYLPREAFRSRLVDAMRELLDLLEDDASARFVLDGQTILVEDTLAVHPEWQSRFARAVRAGQLEVGPWYVLADELIPSGESLLRNLLIGSTQAQALGGRMGALYSPDAFGHPAILPTLAREFGLSDAVVWRGLGISGQDRDLYQWRGPDGRTVLLYHLPPAGYEVGIELTHVGAELADRWRDLRTALTARATTEHVAVFIGADHHAPAHEPAALAARIAGMEPDHVVRWSGLGNFFGALHAATFEIPEVHGELRASGGHTWSLQGVHSTRARLCARHGLTELALQRRAEVLHGLAAWHSGHGDSATLRHAWRLLVQCQFHDTLAGCCSDAVAREQDVRLTSIQSIERHITARAIDSLTGHDPDRARGSPGGNAALLLWNPAARPRQQILTATTTAFRCDVLVGPPDARQLRRGPGHRPFVLCTRTGETIPVQVLDVAPARERVDAARHYPDEDDVDRVRIAFPAPTIDGLSMMTLALAPDESVPAPGSADLSIAHDRICNQFIDVRLGRNGRVTLRDRRSGERFADIVRVIDEDDNGDSYTPFIGRQATTRWTTPARVLATGPFVVALQFDVETRRGPNLRTRGTVSLVLHADSPVLRVRVDMENLTTNHRVRIGSMVGRGITVIAGAAFGFEERSRVTGPIPPSPRERPLPTAPAQRYVLAGAHPRGLVLLVPSFVEYEWTTGHELLHTVFRATGDLSRADVDLRPGMAGWTTPIPGAQELGRHVHEFAIAPVAGSASRDTWIAESLWEDVFLPPQASFVRHYVGNNAHTGGVMLDGDGLVFSALKPAESGDGVVLRCFNTRKATVRGRWRFAAPIARATLLRADETTIECIEPEDGHTVTIDVPARGMSTIGVYPVAFEGP